MQLQQMSQIGKRFNTILNKDLTMKECKSLFPSSYILAAQYVLQNFSMSEDKLHIIMSATKIILLNELKLAKTIKTGIVYGYKGI
jgi:hypothetical protein